MKHCEYYCKNTNMKIFFSSFKVGDLFGVEESVPKYLGSFVVYRFTCSCCNASYIGETTRHPTMRIKEHLKTDSKAHIFNYLSTKELCNTECFEIIGSTTSSYILKLKGMIHIIWGKPSLNKRVKQVNIYLII